MILEKRNCEKIIFLLIIFFIFNSVFVVGGVYYNQYFYNSTSQVMTDHTGITFKTETNGVITINNERYLAFAIKGDVGGVTYNYTTMDFEWVWSMNQSGDDYAFTAVNNDSKFIWSQYYYFYKNPYKKMKITHYIDNQLVDITNTTMYYLFDVQDTDYVVYNETTYLISDSLGLYRQGDFNDVLSKVNFNNGGYNFLFGDIIDAGFTINEFYIGNGSVVNQPGFNILAVGFTKNNGNFPKGTGVSVDPGIEASYTSPVVDRDGDSVYASDSDLKFTFGKENIICTPVFKNGVYYNSNCEYTLFFDKEVCIDIFAVNVEFPNITDSESYVSNHNIYFENESYYNITCYDYDDLGEVTDYYDCNTVKTEKKDIDDYSEVCDDTLYGFFQVDHGTSEKFNISFFAFNKEYFIDPFWDTNTSVDFIGTYTQTKYNNTGVTLDNDTELDNTYYLWGNYTSEIIDLNATQNFTNFSWGEEAPYNEELPSDAYNEENDMFGGINMTDIIVYYRFNNDTTRGENETYVEDYSGNSINLTAKDGNTNTPNYTAGKFGEGLSWLNNSLAYAQILWNESSMDCSTNQTVAFWYLNTNQDGYPAESILSRMVIGDSGWAVSFSTNLLINFYGVGGTEQESCLGCFTNDTNWHHIALIFDDAVNETANGTVSYFIDGVYKETDIMANILYNNLENTTLSIGQDTLNLTIDEFAIWNRTLSVYEIENIYRRGALRLKAQLRSCADATCSASEPWIGYDNTSATFFDNGSYNELNETLITSSRYFQYRFDFETDNNTWSGLLYNVSIGYETDAGGANNPPTIDSYIPIGDAVIQSNLTEDFNITFSDTENDAIAITWYIDNVVNDTYADNNYTFVHSTIGEYNVTVNITDGTSIVWNNWTIMVIANTTAVIDQTAPATPDTILEPNNESFNINISDPDFENLSISWYWDSGWVKTDTDISLDSNYSEFNFTGNYTVNNTVTADATFNISVNVTDGITEAWYEWLLTVTNTNRPVTISETAPATPTTITEPNNETFSLNATDEDDQSLEVSWYIDEVLSRSENISLNENYTEFNFTGNFSASGVYNITANVTDLDNETSWYEWVVTVDNNNTVLTVDSFAPADDPSVAEPNNETFSINITDVDEDTVFNLSWYFDTNFQSSDTDLNYSEWNFTGNFTSANTYNISVNFSDGINVDWKNWTFTVNDNDTEPTIDNFAPADDAVESEPNNISLSVNVSDVDTDTTFNASWYMDTNWQQDTNDTTYFEWNFTGNFTSANTYNITIIVNDATNNVSKNWSLTINNNNTIPVITRDVPLTDIILKSNVSQDFNISFSDVDGDSVDVSWYVDTTFNLSADNLTGTNTFNMSTFGTYNVTVNITDGVNIVWDNWTITIGNNIPVIGNFSPLTNPTITEPDNETFHINVSDDDLDLLDISWYWDGEWVKSDTNLNFSEFNFSGNTSSNDNYNISANVSDGTVEAWQEWSLTVNDEGVIVETGGGGGGGGSSGGAGPTISTAREEGSWTGLTVLGIGGTTINLVNEVITDVTLFPKNELSNIGIGVDKLSGKPEGLPDLGLDVYSYISLEKKGFIDEDLEKAEIFFRVRNDWLNNYKKETLRLYRYNGVRWDGLETSEASSDEEFVYYKAISKGFSVFAIGAEKVKSEEVIKEVKEESKSNLISNIKDNKNYYIGLGFVGVLVLVFLLILLVLQIKKNVIHNKGRRAIFLFVILPTLLIGLIAGLNHYGIVNWSISKFTKQVTGSAVDVVKNKFLGINDYYIGLFVFSFFIIFILFLIIMTIHHFHKRKKMKHVNFIEHKIQLHNEKKKIIILSFVFFVILFSYIVYKYVQYLR